MTAREYLQYCLQLRRNGYEFKKDCPYDGHNMWVKHPMKDNRSRIQMDVYSRIDDQGEEHFNLPPRAILLREDCDCEIRTTIYFKTNNIADIERMFAKYADKLNIIPTI